MQVSDSLEIITNPRQIAEIIARDVEAEELSAIRWEVQNKAWAIMSHSMADITHEVSGL